MTVLVFGSVNADIVFRVPRLPAPGETVLGRGVAFHPGGKGANQAVAAARDGARTAFVGAVGADPLAEIALAALHEAGVDLTRLARVGAATGTAAVMVDATGANLIAVGSGANLAVRAGQVEDAALGPGTVLLCQGEVAAAETAALILRARLRGARCVLNLAPAGAMAADALRALDVLVLNGAEAATLASGLGCGAAAAAIAAALGGGIAVAVTLGAAGSEAATPAGPIRVPAFDAGRVVDTTGAGDTWCGVLAAGLDRSLPLAAAMRRASAAAAIACTRAGAAACPTATETDALLAAAAAG